MINFEIDLEKWVKKINLDSAIVLETTKQVFDETVNALYLKTIDYTPVGNPSLWKWPAPPGYKPGTLKKSWEVHITENEAVIKNPQPYAVRVEYGWSTQAPSGMLRRAMLEFPVILQKIAQEHKK